MTAGVAPAAAAEAAADALPARLLPMHRRDFIACGPACLLQPSDDMNAPTCTPACLPPFKRWIVVPIMVVWSSWASIPFIAGAVPANRRALAVYPLVLLYVALGWLVLIS